MVCFVYKLPHYFLCGLMVLYNFLSLTASHGSKTWAYAKIMTAFATTQQPLATNTSCQLADNVFRKAEREYQAYLCLTHNKCCNYIQLLHCPSTLHDPLSSANPDKQFAFLGDCQDHQPPQLVVWVVTAFDQTNLVIVISDNAIDRATGS